MECDEMDILIVGVAQNIITKEEAADAMAGMFSAEVALEILIKKVNDAVEANNATGADKPEKEVTNTDVAVATE